MTIIGDRMHSLLWDGQCWGPSNGPDSPALRPGLDSSMEDRLLPYSEDPREPECVGGGGCGGLCRGEEA